MLGLEKDSTKREENTIHTFTNTGFRRKKGDSPFVYNLNLKVKKEKQQSNFTNPDPWLEL